MTKSFESQRRHPRVEPLARRPVEIQLMGLDFLEVLMAEDISVGGIGIRIDHEFSGYDMATEVMLLIKLPGKHPFLAHGRVRHKSSKNGWQVYGVEFTHISQAHALEIAVYVDQMLSIGRKSCGGYVY